ncbi:MAG TPA: zinc ribbon domain-containing protein [Anaerolineae bacterium]|nr:zinc ribbon domain-containing protein [Anaerolineae bacterium]HMR65551.1 zinc ribbon domain-containing protein [Anaerolineae bacterium]
MNSAKQSNRTLLIGLLVAALTLIGLTLLGWLGSLGTQPGMMRPDMMAPEGMAAPRIWWGVLTCLVPLLLVVFLGGGLGWWLQWLRPPRRSLRTGEQTCPNCGRPVQPEWQVCPFCGFSLIGQTGVVKSDKENEHAI